MSKSTLPSTEALLLENKRLNTALSAAELCVNQLSEVIFSLNSQGNLTFLNPAWEKMTDFTVANSLQKPFANYLYYDDSKRVLALLLDSDISKIERKIEFRIVTANRQIRWIALNAKISVSDNHEIVAITGGLIDVTDRVRAEQALTASEERYELVASSFNDGIWDWDISTNSVYFSPRWKEMLGYSRDELENKFETWTSLLHSDDFKKTIEIVNNFLQSDQTFYESIHRLRHKNGNWVWILDRGIAVRDSDNKPLRVFGSHTDMTRLRTTEEALLQREQELNNVVTVSPDGIVTFTNRDLVSSVNPAFLKMTGFKTEELLLIHRTEFDEKMVKISNLRKPYQADIEQEVPLTMQIQNTESIELVKKTDVCNLGINFQQAPPQYRTLRLTKYCLDNSTTPTIMYFRDITLETEMDRMKSEFLSITAHELRMPVASMYGYCELLLNREFDDLTKRDILQAIYGQCSNIVEMINDLLDLARIETGSKQYFNFEALSFVELVKNTLSTLQSDAHKMEVHYFVDDMAMIYGDIDQIKRAILNILSNAFKYSPSNRTVLLEIKQRINDNQTKEFGVIVQDKGIGMKPEQVSRIFERFWRGDNVRDVVGTGLGMALVKEIMDLHNGHIDVESILGEGTTISLWFPCVHSNNLLGNQSET